MQLPHASSEALRLVLRYLFTAQLPGSEVGWQVLMEACRWAGQSFKAVLGRLPERPAIVYAKCYSHAFFALSHVPSLHLIALAVTLVFSSPSVAPSLVLAELRL